MSTEPKTPEELVAEAFPYSDQDYPVYKAMRDNERKQCLVAIRKQAEQCRPYMQHKDGCGWVRGDAGYEPVNDCTCGLDAVFDVLDEIHFQRERPIHAENKAFLDRRSKDVAKIIAAHAPDSETIPLDMNPTGCGCKCHQVGLFGLMCCSCTRLAIINALDELANGRAPLLAAPDQPSKDMK